MHDCTSVLRGVALAALALFLAGSAAAQETEEEQNVTVTGVLTDASSGAPIAFALVEIPALERSTLSDTAGRFALADVPAGSHRFQFTQLGYRDRVDDLAIPTPGPLRLTLAPRPVEMKGLKVMATRLANRRNSVPVSYHVLDLETLADWNGDAFRLLLYRGGISLTTCSGLDRTDKEWCVYRRGRKIEPSVYLDDLPAFLGLSTLSRYASEDLYAIEIYDRGRHVRVYTRRYIEQLANRPRLPPPLAW